MNPDVIVVGESLIDIITTADGPMEFAGGSGLNVAFGLGRLGVNVGLLTVLGADQHGEQIRRHLDSAGVQLLPSAVRLNRTSTARASLDSTGSARYVFDIQWTLPAATPLFLPTVLHTGSLATFLEPGATHVRGLMESLTGKSIITYDPNIRPAIIGSHTDAQRTFEETVRLADVVKLSDEDAAWLYPMLKPAEAARRILGLGAKLVAVTAGAEGSNLYSESDHVCIPAHSVPTVDTVGAGDSYMSSLIASLLDDPTQEFGQERLRMLGRAANAAAAITVTRHGANPPTTAELQSSLVV